MQSVVDERILMELSGDDTGTKTPKYSGGGHTCLIVTLSTTNRAWNGLVQDPALSRAPKCYASGTVSYHSALLVKD